MTVARFEAVAGRYWIEVQRNGDRFTYHDRDGRSGELGPAFTERDAIETIHLRAARFRTVVRTDNHHQGATTP